MDEKVIKYLQDVDPIISALLKQRVVYQTLTLDKSNDYFVNLCRQIINQQLTSFAANAIRTRFLCLFPGKRVTAKRLLAMSDEKVRSVGMSRAKAVSLKDLALKVVNDELNLHRLDRLSNEDVIQELTKVKGIGQWTAEMFLMFSFGREDVFSFGDLGLQKAVQKLYHLKEKPTRKQLEEITKKWSPYRTYVARILWKSLELK